MTTMVSSTTQHNNHNKLAMMAAHQESTTTMSCTDNSNCVVSLDQLLLNPLVGFRAPTSIVSLDDGPLFTVISTDKKTRRHNTSKPVGKKFQFPSFNCHRTQDVDEEDDDDDVHNEDGYSTCSTLKTNSTTADYDNDDNSSTSTLPMEDSETEDEIMDENITQQEHRHVTFAPFDKIVWIPSFRDYTPEQHARIWASCDEIDANAQRGRHEFRWEGADWRTALEEDDFILCSDGNRYHPATVYAHLEYLKLVQEAQAEAAQAAEAAEAERRQEQEEERQPLDAELQRQVEHSKHRTAILASGLHPQDQRRNGDSRSTATTSTTSTATTSSSGRRKIKKTATKAARRKKSSRKSARAAAALGASTLTHTIDY